MQYYKKKYFFTKKTSTKQNTVTYFKAYQIVINLHRQVARKKVSFIITITKICRMMHDRDNLLKSLPHHHHILIHPKLKAEISRGMDEYVEEILFLGGSSFILMK